MKQATCRQLRGPCDAIITGETADEMGDECKNHVKEMVAQGDEAHIEAMEDMRSLSPEEQMQWYENFKDNFSSLQDA